MNAICNTAFYCCGVRMWDAISGHAICGDDYASRFMDERGNQIFNQFRDDWACRFGMLIRHRLIDGMLEQQLCQRPGLQVVIIGAGFDSRPFRLQGGQWIELDVPGLMRFKEQQLAAASCPNTLRRLTTDFSMPSLRKVLSALAGKEPVLFLLEGVFIYFGRRRMENFLTLLRQQFPRHQLLCDLVSPELCLQYGSSVAATLARMGTPLRPIDAADELILANGYRLAARHSVLETAIDLGICPLPKCLLPLWFAGEAEGNAVFLFETA